MGSDLASSTTASKPASPTNDLWLVRTSINVITGPFTRDKVCQMIKDGELGPQDEVCRSNSFWIFLHEIDEVRKQLGIEAPLPLPNGEDEEVTDTQTKPENEIKIAPRKTLELSKEDGAAALPDLAVSEAEIQTSIISQSALDEELNPLRTQEPQAPELKKHYEPHRVVPPPTEAVTFRTSRTNNPPPKMLVLGDIEKPSWWRMVAFALFLVALFVVYSILDILKRGH